MKVVVLGSIMTDLVARCERLPARGETVAAASFGVAPGGKGANQAVACARMGCATALIGAIGHDTFGANALGGLRQSGVDTRWVYRARNLITGVAVILIDGRGENTIVVARGANDAMPMGFLEEASPCIAKADVLLVQLEMPLPIVERGMDIARACGVPIFLDPAPARQIPDRLIASANFIAPNRQETRTLTGIDPASTAAAIKAATVLHGRGARAVIIKRGPQGCLISMGGLCRSIAGMAASAFDTVGAGDCFAGAWISRWLETKDVVAACRFANAAGALKVERAGAQTGIPHRYEVEARMLG